MDKRITLNKLLSYVSSISTSSDSKDSSVDTYKISAFKNDLAESIFKLLSFGETNTLGDLPKKLKSIFDPFITDMKRIGIMKQKSSNISLLYSLLFCIKSDFADLSDDDKFICIEQLNNKLLSDLHSKKLFELYGYNKLGWTSKELYESILNYKNNVLNLRFLSDYLNVNIFMFNINEDKIYCIYPEEKYNLYKPSIFLSFFDGIFEPIVYKSEKIWKYDFDPLRKLIAVDKKYIGIFDVNFTKDKDSSQLIFSTGPEDLLKYLPKKLEKDNKDIKQHDNQDNEYDEVYAKNPSTEIYINDPEDSDIEVETAKNDQDIFCTKSDTDTTSIQIHTINPKMNIAELQKLAKELDISINKGMFKNGNPKLKTRAELYSELLSKIKI